MPRTPKSSIFEELGDPTSPTVKDAVTRTCELCGQPPGKYCTQIVNGAPLSTRLVHYIRTTP